MDFDEPTGRSFLALPAGEPLPTVEKLIDDARATVLHNAALRAEIAQAGLQVSPIWEDIDGQAALRATVVPSSVEHRHFEGKGMALLALPEILQMIADAVDILAGEPAAAAHALRDTASLWLSDEAPVRPIGTPYKAHFKLLTLVLADFLRKVGAGFDPLEWLTSLGLLPAFHDPEQDPPLEEIRATTREKTTRMLAEEAMWLGSMLGASCN